MVNTQSSHHSESRNQKRKNQRLFGDVLVSIAQKCDDLSSASSSASSSVADSDVPNESTDLFSSTRLGSGKHKHSTLEFDNCDGDSLESEKAYKLSSNRKNNRSTSPSLHKTGNLQTYEKESVSGSSTGRKQKVSSNTRELNVESSSKPDDVYT